jgi:hypothetical protein
MRSPRWILAVTTLCAVTALSSCSGSDSDKDADSPSSTAASGSGTPDEAFHRKCTAEIEITGDVQASWNGNGSSSNQAGPTIYDFAKGEDRLSVYAGKDDIPTSANFTIDGATYTTSDPETGLDVAGNGTSATVDADTVGVKGPGPHLKATFTCGKGKG